MTFRGWALDIIGEIRPASSKQQKYILVGIDYFTKWIEAAPHTDSHLLQVWDL